METAHTFGHPLRLAGAALIARPSGALHWPARDMLVVSDLHLGKAERAARRRGALLPPYETEDTLARLEAEIADCAPAVVVSLGDAFDDMAAAAALEPRHRARLAGLMRGRAWVWVTGNHDPAPTGLGGEAADALEVGPLLLRHIAGDGAGPGEVSGHYHPKAALSVRGRRVSRPCFVHDGRRLILPAFGTYTGGLGVRDPAVAGLLAPGARAILTGRPMVELPL
jgi:DNA ligase-associated metallophosphoesterase